MIGFKVGNSKVIMLRKQKRIWKVIDMLQDFSNDFELRNNHDSPL